MDTQNALNLTYVAVPSLLALLAAPKIYLSLMLLRADSWED